MIRSTVIGAALALAMVSGGAREALSQAAAGQEPVTFTGAASCIDAEGMYTVTWTLTLALGEQEMAVAEALFNDVDPVDGLDLIGQPQTGTYPFSGEAGNIFTSAAPRLVNGPNVATTTIDTNTFNPETLTASGMVISSIRSVDVSATVNRPEPCAA